MKWHEPKLGEFRTECPIGFKLSYFYQKNFMMMTEFSNSCGSEGLSLTKQQVDENRCVQRIERDQCTFCLEEMVTAFRFPSASYMTQWAMFRKIIS